MNRNLKAFIVDDDIGIIELLSEYLKLKGISVIVQVENGRWTGILLKEDYLILLFDAPSEAQISRFLTSFKVE